MVFKFKTPRVNCISQVETCVAGFQTAKLSFNVLIIPENSA